jgi:hypothetical protein
MYPVFWQRNWWWWSTFCVEEMNTTYMYDHVWLQSWHGRKLEGFSKDTYILVLFLYEEKSRTRRCTTCFHQFLIRPSVLLMSLSSLFLFRLSLSLTPGSTFTRSIFSSSSQRKICRRKSDWLMKSARLHVAND